MLRYEKNLKFVDECIQKGGHVVCGEGGSSVVSTNSGQSSEGSREEYERVKQE